MEEGLRAALLIIIGVIAVVLLAIAGIATAIAGAVVGGLFALGIYGRSLVATIGPEAAPISPYAPGVPPAIRGYFFGKGYRDVRDVTHGSFHAAFSAAGAAWKGGAGEVTSMDSYFPGCFRLGMATGLAALFGPALIAAASATYLALLVGIALLVYSLFFLTRSLEQVVMLVRGFVLTCPADHTRLSLPTYLCPKCEAPHDRLIPSIYGVFRHRCRCNHKLPSSFFVGRGALKSRCPKCDYPLSRAHTEARKICVPIVGATSVGKTAFALGLCRELTDTAAPRLGLTPKFLSPEAERAYRAGVVAMSGGRAPGKTFDPIPHALDLLLDRDGKPFRLVYLYDPAGEAFSDRNYLLRHRFLAYPKGIVLMLDPFAFGPVAQRAGASILTRVRASSQDSDDVVAGLVNILESEFGLKPMAISNVPLAVVVNKIDAAGLEAILGPAALARATPASPKETERQTHSRVIRQQLLDWEQTPLIDQLETRFRRIGYFAASALGRSDDGSTAPFRANGVLNPFGWLMKEAGESWWRDV